MSAATSENKEKAAQKVRFFFVQLASFGPVCSETCRYSVLHRDFLWKALAMRHKCVYNKDRTGNGPQLFTFPFLLNYVTILLQILWVFCKCFAIRRRTAYEHTV
jgi:hypothetical protein